MKNYNIFTLAFLYFIVSTFGVYETEKLFEKLYNFNWKLFWKVILVITTIIFAIQMTLFTFYQYSNLTFYLINASLTIISSIILNFYKFKEK